LRWQARRHAAREVPSIREFYFAEPYRPLDDPASLGPPRGDRRWSRAVVPRRGGL